MRIAAIVALCTVVSTTATTAGKVPLSGFVSTAFGNKIAASTQSSDNEQNIISCASSSSVDDGVETFTTNSNNLQRRKFLSSASAAFSSALISPLLPAPSLADDSDVTAAPPSSSPPIIVIPSGDVKKLFNEGRALEAQGNILAAQRLYSKVTKIAPTFIYGWSSLGNTLVAQGQLPAADESYTKAVSLCRDNNRNYESSGGKNARRCDDLYLLLLNRGSVRLNNQMQREALEDLSLADSLRGRPDAVVLQNLARAQEINGYYSSSDRSYNTAISMTANEVNPFWLRASMVKYQLKDEGGAMDLLRRVENRFPEAPEVRAAYATILWGKGGEDNEESARKKFLQIPDRQRKKYGDGEFLEGVVAWPPRMKEGVLSLAKAVGDVQ
eukprot:CAMPEP_0171335642 /NCGR_PEP_ID=MMETSP0878-20121228/5493_1 /TAXON_ID=67004 /ORGANISM="Thalassiosira weissflogii, Strain CCMP1336" /LENGTH=383 /DNA_ID=CAMNT_0011836957 /DNA_START=17 /DNA_END=1168 /DNA_ORIENTATION=-